MNVRNGLVAAGLGVLALGVVAAGCTGVAGPITEPTSSPIPATGPAEPTTGAPAVSWLWVTPARGTAGAMVSLDVACLDQLSAVRSPVLDIGRLQANLEGHQPWHLFGTATVRSDAAPGRYRISATCGASELSTDFTVEPARSR